MPNTRIPAFIPTTSDPGEAWGECRDAHRVTERDTELQDMFFVSGGRVTWVEVAAYFGLKAVTAQRRWFRVRDYMTRRGVRFHIETDERDIRGGVGRKVLVQG